MKDRIDVSIIGIFVTIAFRKAKGDELGFIIDDWWITHINGELAEKLPKSLTRVEDHLATHPVVVEGLLDKMLQAANE